MQIDIDPGTTSALRTSVEQNRSPGLSWRTEFNIEMARAIGAID